jgi:hypothetical protein
VLVGKESASDNEEDFKEEEVQSPEAKRRKTPPTTPSMLTNKRVSMKPAAHHNMSMADLNKSAARMGLTDIQMNVGGVSVPILRGSWQKKIRKEDDEGGFVTTFKDYNLIQILPHAAIHLKQCELLWLNPQQLRMGIVWPKRLKSAIQQVAFQTAGSDTSLVKTMMLKIACKPISIEKKKYKKRIKRNVLLTILSLNLNCHRIHQKELRKLPS